MIRTTIRGSVFCGILLLAACKAPEQDKPLTLWYDEPAATWTEALPIGNGRLGAMIYGGVDEEHIQFNEETLWTGAPRAYAREGAVHYLEQIRRLLREGKQDEAEALAEVHFMGMKFNEAEYPGQGEAWLRKVRQDIAPSAADMDDSGWHEMTLPVSQGWESTGLDGVDGAIWFRNSFELPNAWHGRDLVLRLGRVRDLDYTYVNGKMVGWTEGREDREYVIDASLLKPGRNVIAVQVINFYDKGGFTGGHDSGKAFTIRPEAGSEQEMIKLSAGWKYRIQDYDPPAFPRYQADYQPFGDVWFQFQHDQPATDYRRELDISNALAAVSYTAGEVKYTRTCFASAPHQAIVMHIAGDKPGNVSVKALLSSPHKFTAVSRIDDHTLGLSLAVQNGALKGAAHLYAQADGGTMNVTDAGIAIKNANEVTFYLTAATNFQDYKNVSGDAALRCKQPLAALRGKTYKSIRLAHVKEYRQLFNTLSVHFGAPAQEKLPTDERIRRYNHAADPSLIALYLQYGRYLLLSSSRPGTQPANLQGIWNDRLTPPWGSKYTANINVEMNYWPADLLNLPGCLQPFIKLAEETAETGKLTAQQHYGARGWVLHHNTDLWRGTAPVNAANHGIWVTGGAWLCHRLWDHYLFTQDRVFLEKRAYPVMKEAAVFFTDFLVKDPQTGWLISTPSNSPEQGGLVAGPTMDHQLIRDLFKNCIAASEVLQTDTAFRNRLEGLYPQIAPNQVGKHGQLQEWLEDSDDPDNRHRHVSHLWGVYPGTDITGAQPEMLEAAKKSLLFRGDGGTGWSLAWKVNLWARFKDGDHTLTMIDKLLEPAVTGSGEEKGGAYFNLFDAHPPFQIDGNFGGAAGIAEMLVQSHGPYIELLPALPTALPDGEINGVCARGGFELNIRWKNGSLDRVEVISKAGEACVLKYKDLETRFATQRGETYKLNGELTVID